MIDYKIPESIKEKVQLGEKLVFRQTQFFDIYDRILIPIGSSDNGNIIIYSHVKKKYCGAAKDGIQSWTVIESKNMPPASSIDNGLYSLIEILLSSGYTFYVEN